MLDQTFCFLFLIRFYQICLKFFVSHMQKYNCIQKQDLSKKIPYMNRKKFLKKFGFRYDPHPCWKKSEQKQIFFPDGFSKLHFILLIHRLSDFQLASNAKDLETRRV